jgi:hypothetical protein
MEKNMMISILEHIHGSGSDSKYYHNAKKLVEIYREVSWGLQYTLDEMKEACADMGYADVEEALSFLEDGSADSRSAQALEDRAISLRLTGTLVRITESVLAALRDYPNHGEQYFDILSNIYFVRYPLSENALLTEMDISRSTFYRIKKRALSLFGAIIWGYLLPQIMEMQIA